MAEPLALLLDDGVIDEVFTRLKTGKEAEIYLVRHAGEVVAAKVYKERNARNFKNNAAYMEGRRVRNTRTQRAMDKGSRFGQASSEHAWKAKESEALHKLHAAGVRVPKPVMFYEGVLLMEAVLDSDGRPAPRLIEAAIPRERAAEWYADLRAQVVKMLSCDLVHGDLSPYNVLLAWNGPTIIDFPQVVGAAHNSQAERFFERDLESIRRFFASHDPALDANAGDAREIWRAFVRRELTPDFVPTGRRPDAQPQDRRAARPGDRHGDRPQDRGQGRQDQRRQEHGRHGQDRREQDRQPRQGQPAQQDRQPQQPQPRQHDRKPAQDPQRQQPGRQPQQGQPRHDRQPPQGQPRQRDRQPQGQGPQGGRPPERRGGEGRKAPALPEVTVVQRLPGVGSSPPKREGGPGQPHGQGQHHGHRHGRGHGRHGPR
jgi:RIO kinase 1